MYVNTNEGIILQKLKVNLTITYTLEVKKLLLGYLKYTRPV